MSTQSEHQNLDLDFSTMSETASPRTFIAGLKPSSRLTLGVRDMDIQRDLLKIRGLTLSNAIDVCKTAENADRHRRTMNMSSQVSTAVNAVTKAKRAYRSAGATRPPTPFRSARCKYCGRQHEMLKSKCPAFGKECSRCHGRNYFVSMSKPGNSFMVIEAKITDSPCLAIYDPSDELVLENDASEYGLGSVLLQDGKPLGFASQPLTDAERNYAQIEKELLAVIFGMKKFYHYTFARPLTVITDHKPLVCMANKPLSKTPKWLQSMFLNLQAFDYHLIYKPGAQLHISVSLSRAPVRTSDDIYTCNISDNPFNDSRLSEIKAATLLDPALSQLKLTILQGWPDLKSDLPSSVLPYFNYRDKLTVQDGIILRGDRIVITSSLRQNMKVKVHAGHQGINSCLSRARDLILWPGMSNDIRSFVESCDTCATFCACQPEQPLLTLEVPSQP
ncbi:retrovirus-related pol polyprotein from transposon 297 [Plakobranchus ocellatus]|uniref:Retrovirus-related pol polyprotein from transposon 297 n=1 Tax=Plakobranchus ocellatus TaxID=259542 RepID=A0AAV4D522_9GAST|nr:retrovirus-related pol polyprotein from transposon 297 [Plakobranchus ocellatus]